ncbi:MAG: stage II sporulation protein M [Chloroflexi bacterium]|nr:stage II sporulation protein M [Chloroflexota bacterium]MCC6892816.1 stage II sporulation protein M [Anaerolineae bacterium]
MAAQATTYIPHPKTIGWRETLSNALVITRREVRDSFRDWRIITPIIILTFGFPFVAQFLAGKFLGFVSDYGAEIIGERTIPFLLMIVGFFPISISLVIALETFVGEKERRSLEPLLSTPLSNTELYIGKTLAAMIPPLVASIGGMLVYLSSLLLGNLAWRPPAALVAQIILLTVVQALVMVTGAVVVSSQTTSTRAANLLASFIVIPMTLLIQAESAIMFLAPDAESPNGIGSLWAIIVGMVVVTVLLLRVGNAVFNREELLGRTIDQLNLKSTFGNLWRWVKSVDDKGTPARNLAHWYRAGVFAAVRRLGPALWITIGVFLLTLSAGLVIGQLPEWQLHLPKDVLMTDAAGFIKPLLSVPTQTGAMTAIISQNGGILLAAFILSMFTFGTAALILTPAVYFILGYLFTQVVAAGYNPAFMIAAIMTHGIVEIPVIVLAAAAALRMGAVVTKPPRGVTVGQAWSMTFGDTLKIAFGLIIPGLIAAAFIEAFITPQVVVKVLGG